MLVMSNIFILIRSKTSDNINNNVVLAMEWDFNITSR